LRSAADHADPWSVNFGSAWEGANVINAVESAAAKTTAFFRCDPKKYMSDIAVPPKNVIYNDPSLNSGFQIQHQQQSPTDEINPLADSNDENELF